MSSEEGYGFLETGQSIQKDMVKLLASQSRQMSSQTFEWVNFEYWLGPLYGSSTSQGKDPECITTKEEIFL